MDAIDKAASAVLHRATSKLIALFLLPSGWVHNSYPGLIVLLLSLTFFIVDKNANLQGRSAHSGETLAICIAYICHVFLMLFTTKKLKKKFGRDRPKGPEIGEPNRRTINLRGNEHNHSFPSGDTAQSANWIWFLALYQPAFFESLGGVRFGVIYVFLTACARVYYHCHFFGDTMFGAILAMPIHFILHSAGLTQALLNLCA